MSTDLSFVVEPMTVADLDQILAIERVSFSSPWSEQSYRYEITQNTYSTMLVIRQAATSRDRVGSVLSLLGLGRPNPVLGYGGSWLLVDETHISTIAVHPEWRGQGLGQLLLLSLLDEGIAQGAISAALEVRVSNLAAQKLYRKFAFSIVSRQKRYYADNNEDAYIMATPPFEDSGFQSNLYERRRKLYLRLGAGPSTRMLTYPDDKTLG
jgi:ribosomal-protein-alanine N-acetyltransferase